MPLKPWFCSGALHISGQTLSTEQKLWYWKTHFWSPCARGRHQWCHWLPWCPQSQGQKKMSMVGYFGNSEFDVAFFTALLFSLWIFSCYGLPLATTSKSLDSLYGCAYSVLFHGCLNIQKMIYRIQDRSPEGHLMLDLETIFCGSLSSYLGGKKRRDGAVMRAINPPCYPNANRWIQARLVATKAT